MSKADLEVLRPIERRVLKLEATGMSDREIARRFRRRPETITRVSELAQIPRSGVGRHSGDVLSPLERRVLRWRAHGAPLEALSGRFRRGTDFLGQVERLAHYKLGR